jgi:hypothetical protein
MALSAEQLMTKSQEELDQLFMQTTSGPIPDGQAKGTAIISPGTVFTTHISEFISHFGWQGKTFDSERGVLTNRISAFGFNAIVATVYKDTSWLDGKECIVLDYSKTSMLAHWIRDEIRQLEPGFYLGKVYWAKKRLIDFCLEFPSNP